MATDITTKDPAVLAADSVSSDTERHEAPLSRWDKLSEVIWDGRRSKEEAQLVRRLDLFIM